jgi:hypothetical protein
MGKRGKPQEFPELISGLKMPAGSRAAIQAALPSDMTMAQFMRHAVEEKLAREIAAR